MADISSVFGVSRVALPLSALTPLASNQPCKEVLVQADVTNTGNIYITASLSSGGMYLPPGMGITFKVNNVNLISGLVSSGSTQYAVVLWRD